MAAKPVGGAEMARVGGFWSYSRALEAVGGDTLHKTMQDCLSDALAPLKMELFRDNTYPEGGIGSGSNWPKAIVHAVASSVLFFWVQSPRWLEREVCQLEFDAFRDRVARLARAFPGAGADPDALWGLLVTPIHMISLPAEHWNHYDPAIRERYEAFWLETQRHPLLDLSTLSQRRDPLQVNLSSLCLAAVPSIRSDLYAAAALLGTTLPGLLEKAAAGDETFERHWQDEFYRRGILRGQVGPGSDGAPDPHRLLPRQLEAARHGHGGETRRRIEPLKLDMVLLPLEGDADGFWVTGGPAGGLVEASANRLPPDIRPARAAAGYRVWREPAVRAICPELSRYRLDIPNPRQAEALRQALATDPRTAQRLGLERQPASFWFRDADGAPAGTTAADGHALFLASQKSELKA